MKQIVRQYSMDILKQIADVPHAGWLIPREATENQVHYFWLLFIQQFLSTATCTAYCLQTSKNRLTAPPSVVAPPAILSSRDRSIADYS